jgi:hypothetical protein
MISGSWRTATHNSAHVTTGPAAPFDVRFPRQQTSARREIRRMTGYGTGERRARQPRRSLRKCDFLMSSRGDLGDWSGPILFNGGWLKRRPKIRCEMSGSCQDDRFNDARGFRTKRARRQQTGELKTRNAFVESHEPLQWAAIKLLKASMSASSNARSR